MNRSWKSRVYVLVLSLLLFVVPAPRVKAYGQAYHYNVYVDCDACLLPGPSMCNVLTGQWTVDCNGNWSGWGNRPGDECTWYDEFLGEVCP